MARRSIIPLFVPHLGCPMQCVFCDQKRISGSPLPARAADVCAALDAAAAKGIRGAQLAFYGGSFTAVPETLQNALLDAAQPYIQSGVIDSIRLSTRPDAVDVETLSRLRRCHVETVELGSQSMDDGVLEASGRGHSAADTVRAAALVRAAGLRLVLQMMTGLPGSSDEKDIETARRIAALSPDAVRIYPTVIVRDTPLYNMWREGRYREHTVADAVRVCADILPVFEAADIPVIRLGLNPTEELSGGQAAGGAYHPALGELVRSERMRREAMALLHDVPPGASVTLGVSPRRVSAMTGQHRANIEAIRRDQSLRSLRIKPCPEAGGRIVLLESVMHTTVPRTSVQGILTAAGAAEGADS